MRHLIATLMVLLLLMPQGMGSIAAVSVPVFELQMGHSHTTSGATNGAAVGAEDGVSLCAHCPATPCESDTTSDCGMHGCCYLPPYSLTLQTRPASMVQKVSVASLLATIQAPPDQPPIL